MQSARYRDTFREIRGSLGRYFSIMLIVALGCGFFSGIKATMPDMVDSAKKYFDDNKLMDYRLMSSIGIKSEDVEAVRKADGVKGAAPGYAKDVFYKYDNKSCVLKVMSYSNTIKPDSNNYLNSPIVLEGRLPQRSGECVVEKKLSSPSTFELGNTLRLESAYENEDIFSTFKTDTYEIVGIITSPLYIGFDRDATDVGSGEVLSYIMVPETDFVSDYYTEIFIALDGLDMLDPFSDEYRNSVKEKKQAAYEAFVNSVNARYEKLLAQNERDIALMEKNAALLDTALTMSKSSLESNVEIYSKQLNEYDAQIVSAEAEGRSTLMLSAERAQLLMKYTVLSDILSGDDEKIAGYKKQTEELKKQAAQYRAQLEELSAPSVYEFDRFDSSEDYGSFYNDSQKIDKLSKVFPVFFILVAALVCLTTMTRMVDDERMLIGTYKALGYSGRAVSFKFLFYGLSAALIGSVAGTAIGLQVFPKIIYQCYKMLYNMPSIDTPFKANYCFYCVIVSLGCVAVSVLWACLVSLKSQPSELMRPKSPPVGKRVVFERIPFIWKRLSFLSKVTVRNLLRYKKRFLMTIVGVAGCTALIITGFGLKYSISSMAELQFTEIWHYDGIVAYDPTKGLDMYECSSELNGFNGISDTLPFKKYMAQSSSTDGSTVTADLVVVSDPERLIDFINLENKKTDHGIDEENVVITEKFSNFLGVEEGDTITVDLSELGSFEFRVGSIAKNYIMHYIYISPKYFESVTGIVPEYNMSYFIADECIDIERLKTELIKDKHFLGVSLKRDSSEGFIDSLSSLDAVVVMLIVCAGFLATVVLYNLANINITERRRELATLKVLGFYDNETSAYIYRENIVGTVLGIIVGFGLGAILHHFVVITSEVDIVMFDRSLVWYSYVFSAVITIVFAVLVNVLMHFKIKRIDEVESLKSIE